MKDKTQLFRKRERSAPGTSIGLPADLLQKSRSRLRILAFFVLLGAGADLVLMLLSYFTQRDAFTDAEIRRGLVPVVGNAITVLAAGIVVALTLRGRIADVVLQRVALSFEVLICLIISVTNPLSNYEPGCDLPTLTWVTPVIIFFPMIVPSPPRRVLGAAIAAALTRPLGIFLLSRLGFVETTADDFFAAAFSPSIAVVIATFGSRAIYRLGIDVAKARRMGAYELEELIGKGGMGEVWRATHRMLARPAAVKLIRPEFMGDSSVAERDVLLQRFEREAQATARLRSHHTIELYDFGVTDEGVFYYVMELLEGVDSHSLVRRFGPLPPERAVYLLQQACHSLAEAHAAGLIHRDIKPANLFVCRQGLDFDFVKLLDFGLVKSVARDDTTQSELTVQGSVSGTPAFMAPEQALREGEGDARSDLYALGCVAFWLLTGRHVFEGETAMEVLVHHARTQPPRASELAEHPIPEALDRLILACLSKKPTDRPQSAADFAVQLQAIEFERRWDSELGRRWWERHLPELGSVKS